MDLTILEALEITTEATREYVNEKVESIADKVGPIADADTLDGKHADEFALAKDIIKNFIVVITKNNEGAYFADKSFAEVYAAIVSGEYVVFKISGDTGASFMPVLMYDNSVILFQTEPVFSSNASLSLLFYFTSDELVRCSLQNIKHLPGVTESDNGKILTVDNGAWTAKKKEVVSVECENDVDQVFIKYTYNDNSVGLTTITFDDNDYPISVNKDGVECTITWVGFD